MTRLGFLLRSLVHYWRTNLAVLLGVMAGTAVISGALVVGDSVRESLRRLSSPAPETASSDERAPAAAAEVEDAGAHDHHDHHQH